jgi:3,4-dihydroxy-2-butanone 4-phosphate synthase
MRQQERIQKVFIRPAYVSEVSDPGHVAMQRAEPQRVPAKVGNAEGIGSFLDGQCRHD